VNPESSVDYDRQRQSIIASVVTQHAEEAASLYHLRTALLRMPHVGLRDQARCDGRLAAHLDGLSVAGGHAWAFCEAALEELSAGTLFTAAVLAIEEREQNRLARLLALAEAAPESRTGLVSAFGWLEGERLQGVVASLLASQNAFRRWTGIAACALHRVDPAILSAGRLRDPSPNVRVRAFRTVGEIGCQDAVPACTVAVRDDDPECAYWAATSSVLLGNRGAALEALTDTGSRSGPRRPRAFRLALQAMTSARAHNFLRDLAKNPQQLRWLIQGSGIVGDPTYVPWLIKHMQNDLTARLAGEAFGLIAGADLWALHLERPRPQDMVPGPSDDPDDPDVSTDADDDLPWPDALLIEKWWTSNSSRFQKGTRYFMGAPVTREHCIDVLKNGYQRQRILAAHYLCLLNPGKPLFNTSAPAWRQQRLLATMT
jgi:uncharacterized protein (TIGR02270 family)